MNNKCYLICLFCRFAFTENDNLIRWFYQISNQIRAPTELPPSPTVKWCAMRARSSTFGTLQLPHPPSTRERERFSNSLIIANENQIERESHQVMETWTHNWMNGSLSGILVSWPTSTNSMKSFTRASLISSTIKHGYKFIRSRKKANEWESERERARAREMRLMQMYCNVPRYFHMNEFQLVSPFPPLVPRISREIFECAH